MTEKKSQPQTKTKDVIILQNCEDTRATPVRDEVSGKASLSYHTDRFTASDEVLTLPVGQANHLIKLGIAKAA